MPTDWVNAYYAPGDAPAVSYRTGMVVYEEALIGGQFIGRSWNGAGFLNAWDSGLLRPDQHPTPQAFWLEVDGHLLASHWAWEGFEQSETAQGLHTVISLRHEVRPVSVKVHTQLDGTPVLTRWLEVTNTSDRPAALGTVGSWSGVLQTVRQWAAHLPNPAAPLFSVGYFTGDRWSDEGDFHWQTLPQANFRIDGRYRRDRYRHPMFVVRNHATGEHFIGQLAWSGGYSFEFDLEADPGIGGWRGLERVQDGTAKLFFRAGPDAPAPQRLLAPGETIATPALHLGLLHGDLDDCVNAIHRHLRRSVFMPQARGRGGWVESGVGPGPEMTPENTHARIDLAADLGVEVFFLDASWYSPPLGSWFETVGDWNVDQDRFPEGLAAIREHAHARGMLFGLWMDAERLGDQSQMARTHPQWLAKAYDGRRYLGDMLDLTNPEAAAWMESQIERVITENQLDFFRLDMNVGSIGPGAYTLRDGGLENSYWRYYEAFYAVYDRLRAKFPDVIFEHCAAGGGRTDIAAVSRFAHTWVADWHVAPRIFRTNNGLTMALPPEYVDHLFVGPLNFDFHSRLLLFGRPTVPLAYPPGVASNPVQVERLKHVVALYKDFVRPFQAKSRIYHHTPSFDGLEPQGWGVLELAAEDHSRAIAGVFQLAAPQQAEYVLRPRGLDLSRRYRVTLDNFRQSFERDGFVLAQTGLTVRLESALASELVLFEAL
ncbi:MAG: alpha-galactosidase [Anaerolineales bacterium]|nr:alpha-galactosidase [Anaerolineales bacterium]